jgi:hypothetical protein
VSRALSIAGDGQSGGRESTLGGLLALPGSFSHSKGTFPVAEEYIRMDCPRSSLAERRADSEVVVVASMDGCFR